MSGPTSGPVRGIETVHGRLVAKSGAHILFQKIATWNPFVWMAPLARQWPNLSLASLALSAATVEAILLARSTDSVFVAGGAAPLLAVAYLVWFWHLVSWGLFCGGSRLAQLKHS